MITATRGCAIHEAEGIAQVVQGIEAHVAVFYLSADPQVNVDSEDTRPMNTMI